MNLYKKVLDSLVKVFSVLLMCLVSGIVLLMLNELFLRNILNKSFKGMTELAGLMFLWMAFLGVAVLFNRNALITLDVFSARLPKAIQKYLWFANQVVSAALGIVMILAFTGLYPFVITEYYSSMPSFSKMWQFLPLAVCGGFIFLQALYNIIDKITASKKGAEK